MNWRRSATGHWAAYDGKNHYSVGRPVCFDAKNRSVYKYRLRVNDSAVGGATPKLFNSVTGAKKYADSLVGEGR